MEWKVTNALSRDVEREQLNKVLKEIRAAVDSNSTTVPSTHTITNTVNNRYAVARFNLSISGDATGTALVTGLSDVDIPVTINPDVLGVEEAPIDNQAYWRWNAEWQPVTGAITQLSAIEGDGFTVSYDTGDNGRLWATRIITGTANRITVTDGDGVAANPAITISITYPGQTSIITLGTVTTGTWNGTVVVPQFGGTGISSYAVGDLLYASGAITLSKLADVATGNALISGGVATAPSWGKIGLATHVSGNLPVGNLNSGTGASAGTLWRGDATWANNITGAFGIGADGTSLTEYTLRLTKTVTGAVTSFGMSQGGVIQSDVTTAANYYRTNASTVASAFTLVSLRHFFAQQTTIGAGSAVTNQYGFATDSSLTGGTNNYSFYGGMTPAANRYNIYMAGAANNYMAGRLALGATAGLTSSGFSNDCDISGATTSYGQRNTGTIQSGVTTAANIYNSAPSTQAASFTIGNLRHFYATQGTIGASSAITTQVGFGVISSMTGATNNYAFRSEIDAGTGRYNLYMDGSADNFMAGILGIGTAATAGYILRVSKSMTGATTCRSVGAGGTVQSDVTANAFGFHSDIGVQNASFTLTNLWHFHASQGTIGASAIVTNLVGFHAGSNLAGGTFTAGYHGEVSSGTGKWNMYMEGTALNYLKAALLINSTTDDTVNKLQVTGKAKAYAYVTPVQSTASAANFTPAMGVESMGIITAQAAALNIVNPSGSPVEGQEYTLRIKDNGTARAITYDTQYRAMGVALPATTVISKTLYLLFKWNATDTKMDLIRANQEV